MEPIFWTDVGVAVETAASAAIVITDISKAAEGVATYSGTPAPDPKNGDIIVLRNVTGMSAVDDRAFVEARHNDGERGCGHARVRPRRPATKRPATTNAQTAEMARPSRTVGERYSKTTS